MNRRPEFRHTFPVALAIVFFAATALLATITLDEAAKKYASVALNGTAVAGATTVYSSPYFVANCQRLGLWVKATSATSTPDLSIYAEFSPNTTLSNFAQIDGGSKILDVADESVHNELVPNGVGCFLRLKVVGNVANGADTLVDAVITRPTGN